MCVCLGGGGGGGGEGVIEALSLPLSQLAFLSNYTSCS